jgi:hypothetical protein
VVSRGAARTIDRLEVERRIGPTSEPIEALAGGLPSRSCARSLMRIDWRRIAEVIDIGSLLGVFAHNEVARSTRTSKRRGASTCPNG